MSKPEIHLADYRPPDFLVDFVELEFTLGDQQTDVRSVLSLRRNGNHTRPLVLDGEELSLQNVELNREPVRPGNYRVTEEQLFIDTAMDQFTLALEVTIRPQDNTELSGLYCSSGNFCTQCEAEGFRRITYFPDRPDVLSRYKTTIRADKKQYPVLLSNGNLVGQRQLGDGRHQAVWEDPFPKPSYLFALVAGDLACVRDSFTTMLGRNVALSIYTQHHNADKCTHAMQSLKKAMQWDEKSYGREYDLDHYMIVAVDDFNMGAMENKGLNIFNSKYVLAKPETATDADYDSIEGVVAHEYFHNWSGNRVTCRDWFQLSLKEGFTVFRDQEFSADMRSRGVHRIQDADVMRTHQFPEDAGPLAHPVRPPSYQEINNFYTLTVYNKGAEVVRMLYHLVGAEGFRRGTDRYFDAFDGCAVTTDDFVAVMESENQIDLEQFKRWYDQAGTPLLELDQHYDDDARRFSLEVRQSCPPTPGQPDKEPFHLPLAVALLDTDGEYLALDSTGAKQSILQIRKPKETFVFENIPSPPVLSALRGFSAPVKVDIDYTDDELYFLVVHDTDPFSRWQAAQGISTRLILGLVSCYQNGESLEIDQRYLDAVRSLLEANEDDLALLGRLLQLPSEAYVGEHLEVIDPEAVHFSISYLKKVLAQALWDTLLSVYRKYNGLAYQTSNESVGQRSLKNTCLDYLLATDQVSARRIGREQFVSADNMTDTMAALSALNESAGTERETSLAEFHDQWKHDNLVMDKWLGLHAASRLPGTLDQVRLLTTHESFNLHNPNKVRALVGSFAHANALRFHDPSGAGYRFVSNYVVELDKLNPQVASRLATSFNRWRRYDRRRQGLMQTELQRMLNEPDLSNDVTEIVSKALKPDAGTTG